MNEHDSVPFEETDAGYRIVAPAAGVAPAQMSFVIEGVTYQFSGFSHRDVKSSILPEVLVYEECTVETGGA